MKTCEIFKYDIIVESVSEVLSMYSLFMHVEKYFFLCVTREVSAGSRDGVKHPLSVNIFIAWRWYKSSGHGINVDLICNKQSMRATQNIWTMGDGHAGLITQEAPGVLVTRSGGDHLLALPRGVLDGHVLLQLGSSYMSKRNGFLSNPLLI